MIFTALFGAMWYYYLLDFVFLIILIPAIIFTLIAQSCVRSTYKKYAKVYASTGLTGAEVARKILANAGVFVHPERLFDVQRMRMTDLEDDLERAISQILLQKKMKSISLSSVWMIHL